MHCSTYLWGFETWVSHTHSVISTVGHFFIVLGTLALPRRRKHESHDQSFTHLEDGYCNYGAQRLDTVVEKSFRIASECGSCPGADVTFQQADNKSVAEGVLLVTLIVEAVSCYSSSSLPMPLSSSAFSDCKGFHSFGMVSFAVVCRVSLTPSA